jgi:hypothetical protein
LQLEKAIFWENTPSLNSLYSPSYGLTTPYGQSLAGLCFSSKRSAMAVFPPAHPAFSEDIDGRLIPIGASANLFPVNDKTGNIVGVVEVIRYQGLDPSELRFTDWLRHKLSMWYEFLNVPPDIDSIVNELQTCALNRDFCQQIFPKVALDFDSRDVEIWRSDSITGKIVRTNQNESVQIRKKEVGVIWQALDQNIVVKCDDVNDSILAVPVKIEWVIWSVVLRRGDRRGFSRADEERLKKFDVEVQY